MAGDVHRAAGLARFTDGFADEHGAPVADMPTTVTTMRLVEHEGGWNCGRPSPSLEAMERLDEMGMAEGLRLVVGQMDPLLVA